MYSNNAWQIYWKILIIFCRFLLAPSGALVVILVYYIHIFSALLRSYDYNEFTFAIAGLPAYLLMFSLPKVFVETN